MTNTTVYTNGHVGQGVAIDAGADRSADLTANSEMALLLRELAALRAENRHLRNRLPKSGRYSQRVRKACVDAHALLLAAFSGDATGIVSTRNDGLLKRSAWTWAVAVLRYAGIVADDAKQWRKGLRWIVTDLNTAVLQLETAITELDVPEGYARLVELRRP